MENEDEALARALELSRLEQEKNQTTSTHDHKDQSFDSGGQSAHGGLVIVIELITKIVL